VESKTTGKLDPLQPSQTELTRQANNLIAAFNIVNGQYIREIDLALRIFNLFQNIHRGENTRDFKRALRHLLYQLPGSKSTVDNYVHNLEQDFITFTTRRQHIQTQTIVIQRFYRRILVRQRIQQRRAINIIQRAYCTFKFRQNINIQMAGNISLTGQVQALVNAINAIPVPNLQPVPPREASVVKIDPYYGDEQDPISWIEDFEKAAIANNYTDARKLQIVVAYLKGTAASWLYDRQQSPLTRPQTWIHNPGDTAAQINTTFRQPFIDHFQTEAKICEWQQELTSHQQMAMTVDQYASKLRNLIRRVYPNGDLPIQAQISQFVQGLQPHLKFHVQTSSPQNLDQAIAAARRFETGYQ
jgi:Ty3 transposon capsid-like protein